MIRAVLWDFDGTLADSTELIMRCYRHTMEMHLGECPPDEVWLSGFGMTLESQIARFARSEEENGAMLHTYRSFQLSCHDAMLRPFAGAVETVAELARQGITLAIVTSKHRESALRELEVSPADALFVGDSPHDVAAGRAAGTRTAGALWGPFPRAALEAARPNVLLERPADVLKLLLT